jgi:multiple sugar transport system ATP-binding protein
MAGLELLGVSMLFPDGTRAVDRLDLQVRDGELVVLVGPSGSGKTTTLRLIAGLAQPTAGTIRIAGRDVSALPPRDRDVAMVFQEPGLYGHLTAFENVAFGLRLRRKGGWFSVCAGEQLTASQIDERVRQTASMLGITSLLDRKPAELSGGQQQRVALGRAIARRPRVLLLDEPLASLDVPTRLSLRRELKRLHEELRTTTVYVTHDQAEAMAIGERIAVMNEGRLEQVGTPEEIYERPKTQFVGRFFGPFGMNFVSGPWAQGGGRAALAAEMPAAALAGPVTMGFRPEDAVLLDESDRGESTMEVNVTGIEYQGEACYVAVCSATDGHDEWLVRLERSGARPVVGQRKRLAIRSSGLHWFADGKRIG